MHGQQWLGKDDVYDALSRIKNSSSSTRFHLLRLRSLLNQASLTPGKREEVYPRQEEEGRCGQRGGVYATGIGGSVDREETCT